MEQKLSSLGIKTTKEKMLDRIEIEANEILKQELRVKWDEKSHEKIRRDPNYYGFSSVYLCQSANFKAFSSSVKISTLLKLTKLDRQKGTTIPELIFSCCKWFPKKEAIASLIELAKESENEEKVVKGVFEFQDHEGFNCLISLFQMATKYRNRNNGKYPSGPMLDYIEESCSFLIQLAKSAQLDLDSILNHTTKSGKTLFAEASFYSEKITKQLLIENVRVNSIDNMFMTPFFRVRLKISF